MLVEGAVQGFRDELASILEGRFDRVQLDLREDAHREGHLREGALTHLALLDARQQPSQRAFARAQRRIDLLARLSNRTRQPFKLESLVVVGCALGYQLEEALALLLRALGGGKAELGRLGAHPPAAREEPGRFHALGDDGILERRACRLRLRLAALELFRKHAAHVDALHRRLVRGDDAELEPLRREHPERARETTHGHLAIGQFLLELVQ